MSKITIRDLLIKTIDKYIKCKPQIKQDLNDRKIQNMKKTIYQMIMECFEICLPLSNKANQKYIYIKLTNIIIQNIIENYNEYLPIKMHINPSKIQDIIEKIKLCKNGETFRNN